MAMDTSWIPQKGRRIRFKHSPYDLQQVEGTIPILGGIECEEICDQEKPRLYAVTRFAHFAAYLPIRSKSRSNRYPAN
ncbi:hypothetical protein J31TS4_03150 [Paenibacillus sp. J31TS4]|nr:hypothetical protein J31TS4_03150 [Paenibacillus sp. J31TS4]